MDIDFRHPQITLNQKQMNHIDKQLHSIEQRLIARIVGDPTYRVRHNTPLLSAYVVPNSDAISE